MSDSELSELHDSDPEPDLDPNQDAALSEQLFMRPCKFNGHHRLIFQHNPGILPTPPPLVALYNYLVLTESADTKYPQHPVEEEVWKLPLQRRLNELKVKLSTEDHLEAINMDTFKGHNINLVPIRTEGTESFETPKDGDDGTRLFFLICQKLRIKVHHGCLENPKDPENGEGQLTRFGLKCLSENIEEGNLALFFRNDHLSVVCKHHGTLFVLETNIYSWIKKKCSPMWGTLNLSDLEVVLFTYRFTPADMRLQRNAQEQSVVEFIGKWNQDEEARKNELDDTSLFDSESEGNKSHKPPGKKSGGKKSRQRKKRADKSDTSIQGSTDEKLNKSVGAEDSAQRPCDDTGENAARAKSSAARPDDEYDWIKKSAMLFFDKFKDLDDEMPDGNNDLPSYVRMVEALKAQPKGRRTNLVHINFPDIVGHDPTLAVAILHDRNRLEKLLAEVFLDFRVKHNCGNKEQLKGKIKIRFHDMPPPADSIQVLVAFLESNNINLAELHTFYDGKTATSTSFWGRRVGKGYVDDIIENHRNHRSWNGEFELSDMVIINGKFRILKSAEATATSDTMCKDFLKLIDLLFNRYELPNAEGKPTPPAYFDIFHQEVMTMMSLYDDPEPQKFRAFQRYLSHHPAFKAPWVRSALFGDVWRVIQALRRIIPGEYSKRDPFDRLRQHIGDFLASAKTAWEFAKVYGFSHTPGETDINRYRSCLLVNFLEFLRHLDEHLLDHTRNNNGEQKVKNIIHVDLMIGDVYEVQVATLIRQMMLDLTDAPFASSWRHYEMSECELDNTDPESGKEDEVEAKDISDSGSNIVIGSVNEKNAQLGGMDTSASGSGSK